MVFRVLSNIHFDFLQLRTTVEKSLARISLQQIQDVFCCHMVPNSNFFATDSNIGSFASVYMGPPGRFGTSTTAGVCFKGTSQCRQVPWCLEIGISFEKGAIC